MPLLRPGYCEDCLHFTKSLRETPCNVCCFGDEEKWEPKKEEVRDENKGSGY